MKQQFDPLIGKRVVAYGTAKRAYMTVEMVQPEWEALEEGETSDSLSIGRIVPIYPATEGIHQKALRRTLFNALGQFADFAPDALPADLRVSHRFSPLAAACA